MQRAAYLFRVGIVGFQETDDALRPAGRLRPTDRDGAAWRAFHFEGAMLGYGTFTPAAHAHGGRGGDAAPALSWLTRIALWLMGFFSRRIA